MFDVNPTTFWQFVMALVPLSVICTLLWLGVVWAIIEGKVRFFEGLIAIGILGYGSNAVVTELNMKAMTALGVPQYYLLVATNLVLWLAGVALGLWLMSVVGQIYERWRSSCRLRST